VAIICSPATREANEIWLKFIYPKEGEGRASVKVDFIPTFKLDSIKEDSCHRSNT